MMLQEKKARLASEEGVCDPRQAASGELEGERGQSRRRWLRVS